MTYILDAPDEAEEDFFGFTYRRAYLTTDFILSEAFSGRFRLEASASTVGSAGPVPFVKDLFIRWKSRAGHRVTMGVAPPPAFEIAEDVWGFRSLEKTSMDLFDVVDSRDFGIRADGPLVDGGAVRYAFMIANNNATRPETDRSKRAYAQLEAYPTDRIVLAAGSDYAGYDDVRDQALRLSAFGGYVVDAWRFGVESFWYRVEFDDDSKATDLGVSMFGAVALAPGWEAVVRLDRVRRAVEDEAAYATFVVAGVAYAPHESVRIIPNLHLLREAGADDPTAAGRLTVEIDF